MFKANDLVRVVKQSSTINKHIHMEGLSGFIEEVIGEYAQFQTLQEDGLGGCGAIPLDCLELANDDVKLQKLKKARDARIEMNCLEALARTKRYEDLKQEYIMKASKETGVSFLDVEKIFGIAEEFESDWNTNQGW